jgi:hypothetical protein
MTYACSCDYDMPEFCSTRAVAHARKTHLCIECRTIIQPGQAYTYIFGKWEGYVDEFCHCRLCAELLECARISVPCFCWEYGNLHDNVREMVHEVRHDVPGMMFEWGRRMVRIKREKHT